MELMEYSIERTIEWALDSREWTLGQTKIESHRKFDHVGSKMLGQTKIEIHQKNGL